MSDGSNGNSHDNGHTDGTGSGLPARIRRGPGHPRALTPEVQARILALLAQGNYLGTSCRAAGVTVRTFQHWRRRWLDGDPKASEYDEFFRGVKRVIAAGEAALLKNIVDADNWQSCAWILERRWPERWARKDCIFVRGARKELANLTDAELDELARQARRGRRG